MAIVLVVAFHAGLLGMHGGYIGVDVFFVISGYLITSLLVAEASETGAIHLPRFYARRVRRLFPALAVVVLSTLVLARRTPGACSVPRAVMDRQRAATLSTMRQRVSQFPRATLLDPIEFFCNRTRCDAQRDGLILYADDNHISRAAAERLLPVAYDELAWLSGVGRRPATRG